MREGKELLEKIFEILTATIMKITVFWHNKSCIRVKIYQHGRGTAICVFNLKAEEVGASEATVNAYQSTRHHIPEDVMHVAAAIHTHRLNKCSSNLTKYPPDCPMFPVEVSRHNLACALDVRKIHSR